MNDTFKEFKARIRKLDEVLVTLGATSADFAQAVSQAHRAMRRGDRSREPTPQLNALLERAEKLAGKAG
jgi:ABC-type transporter Mla subunit MlaD